MIMLCLLCSHFSDRLEYHTFNTLLNCQPLRLQTALECVLEDCKKLRGIEHPSVLLCIDELMKCGWPPAESTPDAARLLSLVGAAMDALGRRRPVGQAVVTVVTSLRRSGLLNPDQTGSFRPVHWVPLEGLSFDVSLRLVSNYVERRGGPPELATLPWFCGMVALCSGHPRSREYLARELATAYQIGDDIEYSSGHRMRVLQQACTALQESVHLPGVDDLALVRCIVAGVAVALDAKVGDATVEQLIQSGIFINAGKQLNSSIARGVVPVMSLLLMARLTDLPLHVKAAVHQVLVTVCHDNLSAGGSAFEGLHVAVEVLKRAVRVAVDGTEVPIPVDELFPYTVKPENMPKWWETTKVQLKVPRRFKTEGKEHLHFNFDTVETARSKTMKAPEGGAFIIPSATNNPGCDAVFMDETADNRSLVITFMEARYTQPKTEEMPAAAAAALQADLAAKFKPLTERGTCASLCTLVVSTRAQLVVFAALDPNGGLPRNAKYVSMSVLHRRYSADDVQKELDSAAAASLAAQWPHGLVRVVHTYDTLCKFYPPTFRHFPDLLSPGAAPADGIKSCSGGPAACNLSVSPAPRSASAGPLSSPVRHLWRFGRAGPRLRAAATVVGMALVSGFALASRRKVQ